MLLIECPWCGERDESEFTYGGEAHIVRPENPDSATDEEWADYLFFRKNPKGDHLEQWCHSSGCRRWFNVRRDTLTYKIEHVYRIGETPPGGESMTQPNRLPAGGASTAAGRSISRSTAESYTGFHGDTLASALLANGVRLVGRSFKYHRPRGIVGSGVEEPNALVQLGTGAQTLPNYVATQIELYDGLEAASVNCWPSVGFDLHAVNGLISRFLPPGFYYKTFMWPRSFWPLYERQLRKAGGLGVAPTEPDTDRYDKMHAHCDVLVVGSGPAGIAAALEAGRAGARVILVDEQQELGGSLLASRRTIGTEWAGDWLERRWRSCAPWTRSASSREAPRSDTTTTTSSPCWNGSRTTSGRPAVTRRVSVSGESEQGRSCWRRAPSSAHWCSETTTAPASCSLQPYRHT